MKGKWEASGATEHSKDCEQFNWLQPKALTKLPNIYNRKIRELLEINNLETKAEYDKTIKVLNKDQGNIVNTDLWKPLFRTINMVRHANALRVRFNYVIDIFCLEPQRNQSFDYCSSRMVGSYVIQQVNYVPSISL